MVSVVGYSSRDRRSSSSVGSGSGGGDVEDILKRLGNVETHVSELRSQVSAVLAVIPHLATKADVVDVRTAVADLKADLSASAGLAKADLAAAVGLMKADLATAVGIMKADLATEIGGMKA